MAVQPHGAQNVFMCCMPCYQQIKVKRDREKCGKHMKINIFVDSVGSDGIFRLLILVVIITIIIVIVWFVCISILNPSPPGTLSITPMHCFSLVYMRLVSNKQCGPVVVRQSAMAKAHRPPIP